MLALIAIALAQSSAKSDDVESVYLPNDYYLVRAKTIDVWKEPKDARSIWQYEQANLKITEAIAGPKRILNREFLALTAPPFTPGRQPLRRDYTYPVPGRNEESLWWVWNDNERMRPMVGIDQARTLGLRYFPYLKSESGAYYVWNEFRKDKPDASKEREWRLRYAASLVSDNVFLSPRENRLYQHLRFSQEATPADLWAEAEAFAKVAGQVYHVKNDDERRVMLEKMALNERSSSAGWAMAMLARGPSEPMPKLLRAAAALENLEATSQVMVDYLLRRSDRDGWDRSFEWKNSVERRRMLERWTSEKADLVQFHFGFERLVDALADEELSLKMFKDVAGPSIKGVERLDQAKAAVVIRSVGELRFSKADKEAGIDFLADMVATTKSAELKKIAIDKLGRLSK